MSSSQSPPLAFSQASLALAASLVLARYENYVSVQSESAVRHLASRYPYDSMVDKKKAILLRIPPDLWDSLNRWARDELRSLNGQIEYVLRDAVRRRTGKPVDPNLGPGAEPAGQIDEPDASG